MIEVGYQLSMWVARREVQHGRRDGLDVGKETLAACHAALRGEQKKKKRVVA